MDCNNKLKQVKNGQVVTAVRETDGYTELAEALESYHTGGGLGDLQDSKALFALTKEHRECGRGGSSPLLASLQR
jgi:hypothetical protein